MAQDQLGCDRHRRVGRDIRKAQAGRGIGPILVHAELKAKSGENPSWDLFLAEFGRRYPDQLDSHGTLTDFFRQWWKKLNKRQAI